MAERRLYAMGVGTAMKMIFVRIDLSDATKSSKRRGTTRSQSLVGGPQKKSFHQITRLALLLT